MELLEIIRASRPDDPFRRQTLQSLYSGCCSHLGSVKATRLLAGTEAKQIACMKAIWDDLPEDAVPSGLSYDDILALEKRMRFRRAIRDYMIFEEETNSRYPFAKHFKDLALEEVQAIEEHCEGIFSLESIQCAIAEVVGSHPSLCEDEMEVAYD